MTYITYIVYINAEQA